jgi:hypothetical protein
MTTPLSSSLSASKSSSPSRSSSSSISLNSPLSLSPLASPSPRQQKSISSDCTSVVPRNLIPFIPLLPPLIRFILVVVSINFEVEVRVEAEVEVEVGLPPKASARLVLSIFSYRDCRAYELHPLGLGLLECELGVAGKGRIAPGAMLGKIPAIPAPRELMLRLANPRRWNEVEEEEREEDEVCLLAGVRSVGFGKFRVGAVVDVDVEVGEEENVCDGVRVELVELTEVILVFVLSLGREREAPWPSPTSSPSSSSPSTAAAAATYHVAVLGDIIEGEVGAEAGEVGETDNMDDMHEASATDSRERGPLDVRDEEMEEIGDSGEIKGSEQNRSGRCPGLRASSETWGTCMVVVSTLVSSESELMT